MLAFIIFLYICTSFDVFQFCINTDRQQKKRHTTNDDKQPNAQRLCIITSTKKEIRKAPSQLNH